MPTDRFLQRPATVLRIFCRLEEDEDALDEEAQSEDEPFAHSTVQMQRQLANLNQTLAEARVAGDSRAQAAAQKQIRATQQQLAINRSGQATPSGAAPDFFTLSNIVVVPVDANYELNGFRTADKLTATFPFKDLPLTSRIVRSCLVEAYAGPVPPTAFANPQDWRLPFDKTTIMFRGYVDEWKTEHKDDAATVRIEARSMEAILIDQKVNKLAPIFQVGRIEDADDPKKVRILQSELVTHYLNRFVSALPNANGALGGDQLTFKFDPRGKEPSIDRKLFMKALQTAKSQNQAAGAPPMQAAPPEPLPAAPVEPGTAEGTGVARVQQPHATADTSAWDIITMACELVGCIPVYDPAEDPDRIIVRLPQTVYDDKAQGISPADGFSRTLVDPDTRQAVKTPFRLFVWGRNIKEMSTSRKLGRIKAPAVEVVSINNDAVPAKRVLRARFPDVKRATRKGAKGQNKTNEVITKVVYGIRDLDQLRQIAVGLYHQTARHETSVRLSTDTFGSYQDPSLQFDQDPDVLRLRPGSAVRVLVARYSQDSDGGLNLTPLSDAFGQDEAQISNFLTDQFSLRSKDGGEPGHKEAMAQVAQAIAQAAGQQRSRNTYYVRTINHKFSKDAGWSAELEVVTFARVSADPATMSPVDKATNDKRKVPLKGGKPAKTDQQVAYDRAATVRGDQAL